MKNYEEWKTVVHLRTEDNTMIPSQSYSQLRDKCSGEPVEILNDTAIWVDGKGAESHIFYDPSFNFPRSLS